MKKLQIAIISATFCAGAVASLVAAAAGLAGSQNSLSVIPSPERVVSAGKPFVLTAKTRIVTDTASAGTGEFLANLLRRSTGYRMPVRTEARPRMGPSAIVLTEVPKATKLGTEGYELEVSSKGAAIGGGGAAGTFYGAQTLLQLFPPAIFSRSAVQQARWVAPGVRIQDQPRFAWRGLLLDVARHFFSKDELKRLLDELALHKINYCQLHLTDDQGWRVQIDRYPRLTEVGAWRKSIGFNLDPKSSTAYGPDGRYGGYYTKADVRELVEYARQRHITILPEIEMPGHGSAALAAYPQYSCSGGPYATDMSAGVFPGVFCAGNQETYTFISNVLAEVGEMFPGKYLHIGGDEVTKENWKACPKCQELMRREGLKNEHELQSYFVRRVEKILKAQGRSLIGWSEIREGGLAQDATVMDWIGGAVEAASSGHDVIMTPTSHCYFDYYQSRNRTNEPAAIGAFIPLQTVYSFEPVPPELKPQFQSHILGAQGNLWTEYIPSFRQVEYMAFPRLCALAEVAWSPRSQRDWDDFTRRLQIHCARLDTLGIDYRKGFFER